MAAFHPWPFPYIRLPVCTSHIWFLLNNLSSLSANHLKCIHKVRDHKRKVKFDFILYHFFRSGVMSLFTLAGKIGHIHVLGTHLFLFNFFLGFKVIFFSGATIYLSTYQLQNCPSVYRKPVFF